MSFLSSLQDLLSGFTVIKSFKAEREAVQLFSEGSAAVETVQRERLNKGKLIRTVSIIAGILAQFGVFFSGAALIESHKGMTVGVVLIFVNLMNMVVQPISAVPELVANMKASSALIDKLALALESHQELSTGKAKASLIDSLSFENLCYSYNGEEKALSDLNIRFEAGRSYAIVGGSGSGKSTILNLLLGSNPNYQGRILCDGVELKEIDHASIYDLVSIVQQNVFVFNASLRDNLTLFR